METVSSQIGGRIRQYRKQRGMTQEALALSSGVNVSFLGDIERGIKKPSVESLEKLLKVLGVTFPEFFTFKTEVKSFKECAPLERLVFDLQGRSDDELEVIYGIIKQILAFNDIKHPKI